MLIFNPPYDGRLKEKDVLDFYSFIGDKLKLSFRVVPPGYFQDIWLP